MSTSADERQSPAGQGSSSSAPSLSPREETSCGISSEKDDEESRSSTAHQDEEDEDRSQESTLDVGDVDSQTDDDYFRPIKKLRMAEPRPEARPPPPPPPPPPLPPQKPLTSFFIKDILNHKSSPNSRRVSSVGADSRGIVRPWDLGGSPNSGAAVNSATVTAAAATGARRRPRSADDDSRSEKSESDSLESPAGVTVNSSPLDALFEMTSKAFEGLDADEKASDPSRDHLNLFSSRQQPKKKRKSRTAFTNHQIFELEKRFLYQKYLSPADRDEIAQSLGLTNAQVITWFQNRRAKLKRDMEELKKDVDAAKVLTVPAPRSIITTMAEMNSAKKELS